MIISPGKFCLFVEIEDAGAGRVIACAEVAVAEEPLQISNTTIYTPWGTMICTAVGWNLFDARRLLMSKLRYLADQGDFKEEAVVNFREAANASRSLTMNDLYAVGSGVAPEALRVV